MVKWQWTYAVGIMSQGDEIEKILCHAKTLNIMAPTIVLTIKIFVKGFWWLCCEEFLYFTAEPVLSSLTSACRFWESHFSLLKADSVAFKWYISITFANFVLRNLQFSFELQMVRNYSHFSHSNTDQQSPLKKKKKTGNSAEWATTAHACDAYCPLT